MKNNKIILCLILILALGLRLGRCLLVNRIDKDSVIYIQMAEDGVQKGIKYTFDRNSRIPPLYVSGMLIGEWIGLGAENSGWLISVVAGALLAFAVFLMARCVFRENNLALIAAFLAAIHPCLVRISAEIMRDSLFVSLVAFALAFVFMAADTGELWKWCFAGLFSALATLTRNEGIEIVFVVLIWALVELCLNLRTGLKNTFKKVLPAVLAVTIIFSIFTFPVQISLRNTSSQWKVFDFRISSYVKGFLKRSEKEVLEKEDT